MNEMIDRTSIGMKLSKLRGGKDRNKVAVDLGISVSTLGMYEQGRRIPRDEIKIKIADYYGVSVSELFYTN
ncbi:helix-turn-helix domain-containing protein [Megasphaera vaginalis (ex Srinivasan et al. 2021)]|uniref:DNA-binding helix-turn-helix protein n=1 Tax=Megasphaera vaginalis (ex Srinivasan et al. 2021) TaxID=1111454 RepID=U7ULD6_9FIRM|nr:helix-turn-helix transcriptional regulator [Megasphaera vaginalis (ex Srinivasan et al. 2021)]ERT60227.1 DNA-binding helix-turn-helix protein [Megasphaera vaginalis (ex Srinivasan et al. 2021)]